MEALIALIALTAMEIVLGIDNIVFIAIITGRLPPEQQAKGRLWGLGLAMIMRILLLFTLSIILGLTEPVFHLEDLGIPQFLGAVGLPTAWITEEMSGVSVKDIILLAGGLFLVFALGPAEPLIPLLMLPALDLGVAAAVAVGLVFGLTSVATMLFAVGIGYVGLPLPKFPGFEAHLHTLAGLTIAGSGLLIHVLHF